MSENNLILRIQNISQEVKQLRTFAAQGYDNIGVFGD